MGKFRTHSIEEKRKRSKQRKKWKKSKVKKVVLAQRANVHWMPNWVNPTVVPLIRARKEIKRSRGMAKLAMLHKAKNK